MIRRAILSVLAFIAVAACQDNDKLTLLIGTYTDTGSRGIYTYTFDQNSGESSPLTVTDIKSPSFLAVTPDNRMVYSVSEYDDGGSVTAFDFDPSTGALSFRNSKSSFGRSNCHVNYVGKDVVSANYSSGSMVVFPLEENGNLKDATLVEFDANGPFPGRQESSHIHSSQVSPDGKFLFVIDLGGDLIYRFPVSDGHVTDVTPTDIKTPAGSGPRHFTFSKDARFMYVITELGGTVLTYNYNRGDLELIQEIECDHLHASGSADIHFSPDGKFLYASNRLQGDGICIFSQDPATGMLTEAGYQLTGIHPRNFGITPNGKYVLVACRDSNIVQVFERDPRTGLLTDTHKDISIPHPVCVITVPSK